MFRGRGWIVEWQSIWDSCVCFGSFLPASDPLTAEDSLLGCSLVSVPSGPLAENSATCSLSSAPTSAASILDEFSLLSGDSTQQKAGEQDKSDQQQQHLFSWKWTFISFQDDSNCSPVQRIFPSLQYLSCGVWVLPTFLLPLQIHLSWSPILSPSRPVQRWAQRMSLTPSPSQAGRTPKVSL